MAQRKFIIDGGFKTDDASELLANLTMGGTIDMDSNKILNVATPTAAGDGASMSYVDAQVAALVNGAPGALDTLNELAAAMADDAAFSATVTNSLATKSSITYVDAQITATEGYADTGDAAVTTAFQAADTALETSVNTAWAAADTAQTTSLQTYADTAETDAIAAAASAATAADAAQTTSINAAWAAADGVVTAAYIAADSAQTTALQSYADQAEADAESAAAADATTKADAAQAAAEATATAADAAQTTSINAAWAAADAAQTSSINTDWAAADTAQTTSLQTYADTAEADAISTAAADATAKVNALETSLIDGAPGVMNTLNELAAAMGDDANHVTTMTNLIAAEASTARAAESANAAAITAGDAAVTSAMQTYADQAEADAESAAASDATTKANAALAAAKVYADANDTNTTYGAGSGMALSSTTFSVAAGNGLSQDASGLSMSGSYTGSFTATGDITAYSDESLKTNIQVIDGALGRVEAIRGVTFDRIEDGSTSTGVVAHELEAVLPEAVHTDVNGLKSVAYGNITGLLIEAVKELSAQVAELKAK